MLESLKGLGAGRKENLIIDQHKDLSNPARGWGGEFLQQRQKLTRMISVHTVLAGMSAKHNLRAQTHSIPTAHAAGGIMCGL